MFDARTISIMLASYFKLSAAQCPTNHQEIEDIENVPYASAIGCIIYVMVCIIPDIAHAMNVVSRYMRKHGKLIGKH